MLDPVVQAATYAMEMAGVVLAAVLLVYLHSDARPE